MVGRLLGHEAVEAELFGGPQRFDDLPGGEGACSRVEYLAGVDQIVQRPQGFVYRYARVRAVDLVEVDMIGLESPEGCFALLDYVSAVVAGGVGVLIVHAPVHLGGQHHAIPLAVAAERLPYHLLACTAAVDVGGVQKVYPRVEGPVYDFKRCRFVRASPEHHASKTQLTYLGARAS